MTEGVGNMNVKVRTLDFTYDSEGVIKEVSVRFDSKEEDGTYLNGSVKLTKEEYLSTTSLNEISDIIRTKVQAKLSSDESTTL
jgi:hypothetical protein